MAGMAGMVAAKLVPPTLAVADTPASLTMSPSGDKLYICHYESNSVSAVCLKDGRPSYGSRNLRGILHS